ncbi:MAG: hypothetical protein JWP91_18 [Fibrobacteres bacterium]|nr:hypothetical protein [Fibrobacterota bacterium]
MNSQIPKAMAPMCPKIRFQSPVLARFLLILAFFCGAAHALYTFDGITATRVPDDRIKVDGSPDTLWKGIYNLTNGGSSIRFNEYGKMVILQPDSARNADPAKYVAPAPTGLIFMLSAYDSKALYFYFQVKAATVANSKSLCTTADNFWKADAPEIFLDPSVWDPDTAVYRSYFSADAGGLIYGTSPKTIQIDKPINDKDTRVFFRNRAAGDKFQRPAVTPAGILAVSQRSASDTTLVSVEIKIPYWSGVFPTNFGPGKSMFISWGYNMYPASLWANCNADPIAYRWAKHYLSYEDAATKPPGWRAHDSTHYDPLRSWDGWGRFTMNSSSVFDPKCSFTLPASWNTEDWKRSSCGQPVTSLGYPESSGSRFRAGSGSNRNAERGRDLRGRAAQDRSGMLIFPLEAMDGGPKVRPERIVPL